LVEEGCDLAADVGSVVQTREFKALHSQKVLLMLRDDVRITVNLEGATWVYDDDGGALRDSPSIEQRRCLIATFPNGNRYVFGEATKPREECRQSQG
jgi:hypothetical protein